MPGGQTTNANRTIAKQPQPAADRGPINNRKPLNDRAPDLAPSSARDPAGAQTSGQQPQDPYQQEPELEIAADQGPPDRRQRRQAEEWPGPKGWVMAS